MPRRPDTSGYTTFDQITARLDEIVGEVRKRDLPLESSLDLFDEAVALGAKAVDFVDTAAVTAEEELRAQKAEDGALGTEDEGSKDGSEASQDADAASSGPEEAHGSQA